MFGHNDILMNNKVAILDLGTNTFHVLIAELKEASFRIIHRKKFPVRLGADGINEGIINRKAEKRALSAIKEIKGLLKQYDARNIHAFATSAIRNASNGQTLLQKIKSQSGIEVRVIDGSTEAQYIYHGVRQAIDIGDSPVLIMQVQLIPLFDALHQYHPKTLIGCSGTFDTLSDIYCLKKNIVKDPDHTECPIDLYEFYHIHEDLIHKNIQERLAIPGMSRMRADMITMSSSLVHFIVSNYHFERLRASSYSLKEGIISLIIEKAQIRELSA